MLKEIKINTTPPVVRKVVAVVYKCTSTRYIYINNPNKTGAGDALIEMTTGTKMCGDLSQFSNDAYFTVIYEGDTLELQF